MQSLELEMLNIKVLLRLCLLSDESSHELS